MGALHAASRPSEILTDGIPSRNASRRTRRSSSALSLAVVAIGGIVEIVPLFYLQNTIEQVEGMRPYTPLELAGRDIYVREGCYVCHSQMIRPLRDEVERYGHYSLAAESMYDHPFQWGSKRTGPDLARVGGRYSDEWHVQHLIDPRSVVPELDHAALRHLATTELDTGDIAGRPRGQCRRRRPLYDEDDRDAPAPTSPRKPTRTPTRAVSPSATAQGRRSRDLRRRPEPDHRDGCARRLSADARHAGRLHGLRAALRREPEVTP